MMASQKILDAVADIGGDTEALNDLLRRAHATKMEAAFTLHVQTALETAIRISDALIKLRDQLKEER